MQLFATSSEHKYRYRKRIATNDNHVGILSLTYEKFLAFMWKIDSSYLYLYPFIII